MKTIEIIDHMGVDVLTQPVLPPAIHGVNPRTIMGNSRWESVKREVRAKANHKCMCCGGHVKHVKGDWLESHEVYEVDLVSREFRVVGVVGLCHKCHMYIHQAYLRIQLAQGKVSRRAYDAIIAHGDVLLARSGKTKQVLTPQVLNDPRWCVLFNGTRYTC